VPDVLVVGGGVVGTCAAWFLAERGARVTVVDRGEVGSGCSYGNAGLVVPSHSIPLAAPGVMSKALRWMWSPESPFYIRFRWSLELWSWLWKFRAACREEPMKRAIPLLRDLSRASVALYDRLGIDCACARKGLLLVYRTPEGLHEGQEEARLLAEWDLPSRAMDAEEARRLVPTLRPGVAGAIHFPEDAHLDPIRFVRGLAKAAEAKGVSFRVGVEVTGFEVRDGRIAAVRTSAGELRADEVVLAAGSWSPGVARELGHRLPIQPAKGYSITVRRPPGVPELPLLLMESKVAVTPMGPLLRFAGTLEMAGLDLSINERRVAAIRRGAAEYLEGTESLEHVETWRGLRPCTPDGLPIVGRSSRIGNLILATGHAMIGLSLGPITGQLVAEIACGQTPSIDIHALRAERFE
jgi:D-amino-acid dehydrogenase